VRIYRKYVKLRYRFLPYLYDLFYQGEKTGLPVMRPLVLHYENDPETFNLNGEFLVGESLLVAPVFGAGSNEENGISSGGYLVRLLDWGKAFRAAVYSAGCTDGSVSDVCEGGKHHSHV